MKLNSGYATYTGFNPKHISGIGSSKLNALNEFLLHTVPLYLIKEYLVDDIDISVIYTR